MRIGAGVIHRDLRTEWHYIRWLEWYHPSMERTQISLTSEQARELRRLARARGTSMAALIREAVDRTYTVGSGAGARWRRALESIGGFRSDRADVAERHDEALADAFES